MEIGGRNIRDRRGAAHRILEQVKANGCLPRYASHKTVQRLKDAGAISFHGGRYHLGAKPDRAPGFYWVKDCDWSVAEWSGTAWYQINGQRPLADDEFAIIGEKIEPPALKHAAR
jgi:hypothetical protein